MIKVILVVLLAIAGALSLFAIAVWKALQHGPHTKPIVEIGQLQTAFQAYKEKAQAYPPCLADVDPVERKLRFMKHLVVAFPNAAYGGL